MFIVRTFGFILAVYFGVVGSAIAAVLDFTDSSFIAGLSESPTGSFSGNVAGIGFTLSTSDPAGVNFNQLIDGSSCASGGMLACELDGAGIGDDEIRGLTVSSGQTMKLDFDQLVNISTLFFLDLFKNSNGTEQAAVSFDGGVTYLLFNALLSSDGGYLAASAGLPQTAMSILFTAFDMDGLRDDRTNDYALAGLKISAVPIPAALPLFGSALAGMGLIGWRRRRNRPVVA